MTLLAMLKKGGLRQSATATVATLATASTFFAPSVARVATVAVANLKLLAANDPATSTMMQADLPTPDVEGLPTSPTSSKTIDIGTIRPPGLSPKLLAASLALDAQIAAGALLDADSDRWCYPNSPAMNGAEIDLFARRQARFKNCGLPEDDAESLADKLVIRDRDLDGRRLCLECAHLGGYGQASWRCGNWQAAGVAIKARDHQLPVDLVQQLQRCDGFAPI
jgi:hypothetical protein